MMGDDTDAYPVRDNNYRATSSKNQTGVDDRDQAAQRAAQQRRNVSRWERDDLEDKYLRLYEENLVLKKHARKQEEKIKRMATKLLRLVSDKKKTETDHGVKKCRDVETEEMLEELHGKIRELEKYNVQLKEKLMVSKQQLMSQGTRKPAYPFVQSRINTGMQKAPTDPRIAKNMRVVGPPSSRTVGAPRYGHSLLEDTRAENKHLENHIQQQNEQLNISEQEIEMLKEQMRIRESEYEEDLLKIKQQMSHGQRSTIQENIDIIRLQREVKEKATKLTQLQAQYSNMDEKLRTVKNSHDQVLYEMEGLNGQLKDEQTHRMQLENELKQGSTSQRTLVEFQERISDLQRECDILKEANEKLVSSAFDMEHERQWRQRENALKVQIAQLEATLKSDVGEKGSILDKLTDEKDKHESLEDEHRELRVKYFQIKQEYDELHDKMKFFTKESAVDFQEIEEALVLVKQRKEKENQELEFLHKVDDEIEQDASKTVTHLRADHADTINELEKTRNMLIVQHKINKDYQMEVGAVTQKMEENKSEYETRLQEYAQLLDLRAVRIRKLETQLRDVAYGTRAYRIPAEEEEGSSDVEEMDETIHLERGQNMFEIHVKRVNLTQEALRLMGDDEPSIFATWEFYEFEIQSTAVMKGPKPDFEFTSQYLVKVDDFFLHYLQRDSCTLELHQSYGTDYRTIAACQLKMKDILSRSQGRLHGTVQLTGVEGQEGVSGANFGMVEYWVRLRVPMEQALRLYKERSKALGYIETNMKTADQALTALDESAQGRPPDNVNQLHIKILRCADLVPRRDSIQPSPYCLYKFFDYDDHDTTIIPGSNCPEYNDHKSFPVPMTADLDKYLKSKVYVFDDTDPEQGYYIGLANVPLLPLAHDKSIKGTFELRKPDGTVTGTMELKMKWQFSYLPPKASTKTPAQLQQLGEEMPEQLPLLPGEEEALHQSVVSGAPGALTSTPSAKPPYPRGPAAASTPHRMRRQPDEDPDELIPVRGAPEVQVIPPTPTHRELPQSEYENLTPIREQSTDGSEISEGTPVPGESEPVTSDSEGSTMHGEPPQIEAKPAPPSLEAAAKKDLDSDGTLTEESTDDNATLDETQAQRPVPKPRRQLSFDTPHSPGGTTWPGLGHLAKKKKAKMQRKAQAEKTPEQLVDEEMGEDTMFEDHTQQDGEDYTASEEEEVDEDLEEYEQGGEVSAAETEDSDGVILASPNSRPQSSLSNMNHGDHVTVIVSQLELNEDAPLLFNDAVSRLFIEYCFLGVPREDTETPFSLPKMGPGKSLSFNFTKVFHLDFEQHYERRQYLASMLLPDDPDEGRIRFTVVSEPEDDEGDCADVGVAFASVRDILNNRRDIEDQQVPVYDVEDEETEIGSLQITVRCLAALDAVQKEMQQSTATSRDYSQS